MHPQGQTEDTLMDPLASWILEQWKASTTWTQRSMYEEGLEELGYWIMERPLEMDREEWATITRCTIYTDCDWMQEFEWFDPDCECMVTMAVYKEKE